jgi:hypothetical protein
MARGKPDKYYLLLIDKLDKTKDNWRRGGDSNPRDAYTPAGFQDQCIQPLCHLSAMRGTIRKKNPFVSYSHILTLGQFILVQIARIEVSISRFDISLFTKFSKKQ